MLQRQQVHKVVTKECTPAGVQVILTARDHCMRRRGDLERSQRLFHRSASHGRQMRTAQEVKLQLWSEHAVLRRLIRCHMPALRQRNARMNSIAPSLQLRSDGMRW